MRETSLLRKSIVNEKTLVSHITIIICKKIIQTSDSRKTITDSSIANTDWLIFRGQ
jgi:hypothetical protein